MPAYSFGDCFHSAIITELALLQTTKNVLYYINMTTFAPKVRTNYEMDLSQTAQHFADVVVLPRLVEGKRRQIADVLSLTLMDPSFDPSRLAQASVEELAVSTGMSQNTLYRRFGNAEGVRQALSAHALHIVVQLFKAVNFEIPSVSHAEMLQHGVVYGAYAYRENPLFRAAIDTTIAVPTSYLVDEQGFLDLMARTDALFGETIGYTPGTRSDERAKAHLRLVAAIGAHAETDEAVPRLTAEILNSPIALSLLYR